MHYLHTEDYELKICYKIEKVTQPISPAGCQHCNKMSSCLDTSSTIYCT